MLPSRTHLGIEFILQIKLLNVSLVPKLISCQAFPSQLSIAMYSFSSASHEGSTFKHVLNPLHLDSPNSRKQAYSLSSWIPQDSFGGLGLLLSVEHLTKALDSTPTPEEKDKSKLKPWKIPPVVSTSLTQKASPVS